MSNKLTEMAKELLIIESDITFRFDYSKERPRIDDFSLYVFNQTWGSTALGFGGIGGQAMTQANTYVFVPETCEQKCFVYFGGRFAYAVPWSQSFAEDLHKQSMKSVAQSCAYYR